MLLGPNIWGPHLWQALHMISIGYPNEPNNEQKKHYKTFFENFHQVIPCAICSNNYKKNLLELPITNDTLKNRNNLATWLINIHNIVNKELGKNVIEHDDALLLIFNNFNNTDNNTDNNTYNNTDNNTDNNKQIIESFQNEKTNTKIYYLCILILIFFILVIIAIVYKKN
jgi:hypothetical protein